MKILNVGEKLFIADVFFKGRAQSGRQYLCFSPFAIQVTQELFIVQGFLVDLLSHGVPKPFQSGCPNCNLGQISQYANQVRHYQKTQIINYLRNHSLIRLENGVYTYVFMVRDSDKASENTLTCRIFHVYQLLAASPTKNV